jgi:hypothetical protein
VKSLNKLGTEMGASGVGNRYMVNKSSDGKSPNCERRLSEH